MKQKQQQKEALLPNINSVQDLRALPDEEMPRLAQEIRQFLIEKTALRGGHLASNLGVVEITLAIHRIFDTPEEKVIWDVGHQSYVHKILTGRKDAFDTLRIPGGLSGFPRREEGEFDPFGTGHSSTSVSAALGIAQGEKLKGSTNHTVAVIGDGALTGGLAHEAINNCDKTTPLVLIINENEMSIAPVTGGFPRLVARMRISRKYRMVKHGTRQILRRIPLIGRPLYRLFTRIRNWARNLIYQANYFEEMGFHYLGPYDGHDYEQVKKALEEAKRRHQAVVVHFRTTKGKGHPEAEKLPDEYHCIYPAQGDTPHFYQAFGEELVRMGEEDEAICAVTPATGSTTGLVAFGERFPDRTFDVGIAEAHALTFSAGLATMGYKPYAVIYSSFLQRGYDQLIHDIALQNLPVHLIVDRASLAPADGPTHHGIYDVSFLSQVPNVEILAPATLGSLRAMLRDTREAIHPTAIRYANTAEDPALAAAFYPDGDWEHYGVRGAGDLTEEAQVILVSYGRAASRAWEALGQLQEEGIRCGMLLLERLTSHAEVAQEIARAVPKGVPLVFFEEGIYHGGAGMCLSQALGRICPETPTSVLAVVNPLAQPTSPCDLYEFMGISTRDLVTRAREIARK